MVPEGYKLVFEDDFNGNTLDLDKWEYRALGKRRCGFNGKSQVSVEDGNLVMRQKYFDGEYGLGWYGGMIKAKPRFCRGYFEIRCICSEHHHPRSFWSAFWFQGTHPYEAELSRGGIGSAEIDIIEAVSNMGGLAGVESNIHVAGMKKPPLHGHPTDHPPVFRKNIPDCYTAYHTYALEWTDKVYRFFVDGELFAETSWGDGVSTEDEELIVSLELPEVMDNPLDQETAFIVDYVRVYQDEKGVMVNP
ncbi:MAG: glycoside hydrolase family 16 protein [Clostridia bacterium]|nr:glycoside hydrolase family 16 protein [Clostridia bacterium]